MSHIHRWRHLAPVVLLGVLASCDRPATGPAGGEPELDGGRAVEAPLLSAGPQAIPDRYIVVLNPETGSAAAAAQEMAVPHGARVHHTYDHALKGFAATLTPQAVEALRRNPRVRYVAEDAWAHPTATQTGATWGIDRIDQRNLPLSGSYTYTATGAGVRVYVIDSGIRTSHNEFGGRASVGTDFMTDGRNGQDCSGHGTHVAGTIAGATYGVAKAAQVIAVRVFPCSGGSPKSTTIAAVNWVTANAQKPAVVNMSLGGGYYAPENEAVQASIATGLVYVISAGNNDTDACQQSPASTPQAITVGATTSDDQRSWFSNWGTCVDIFAPGSEITSAWWETNTQTNTIDGTSMAAPHVAGLAAIVLQGQPTATPAAVAEKIVSSGSMNRITDVGMGSPNNLLFSGLTPEPPAPTILLNPSSLGFTFVRPLGGTAALHTAPDDHVAAPAMKASAGGESKPASADPASTLHAVATTASTLSARVVLSNPGTGPLDWTATSDQPWLAVDPQDGAVSATYTALLNATVTPGALAAGTYSGAVTLQAPGATNGPAQLPVTLHVAEAPVLVPGAARTGLSGSSQSQAYYVVNVPASATRLTITTSEGSGDADLYLRYGQPATVSEYDCRPFAGGNSESCDIPYPTAGTYYVMLRAFSAYSGVTLSATFGGPPEAPRSLVPTVASASAINLAWTDGSANETSFTLARSAMSPSGTWSAWQDVATPAANAVSLSNTGLASGTTYRYRIRACNAAGCSSWTASANATTPGVAPPTAVVSTPLSGSSVQLAWTDMATNETSYMVSRVQRNADLSWGPWVDHPTPLAANAASFTYTGLVAGATYQFRVRACNAAGCSVWVGSRVTLMPTIPTAPTGAARTALSATSARVTWTDASTNETSFGQNVRLQNPDGTWGAWQTAPTVGANATAHNYTGLLAGRTYQFAVRACNGAGCSGWAISTALALPAS